MSDPNGDYGILWLAVHDYLVAQASEKPNVAELSRAYSELVEAHNMIHDRYVSTDLRRSIAIAGVSDE